MRILLVEDHPIMRLGLRTMIEEQADMAVAGEVETPEGVVPAVRELRPDLVILALRLQGELRGPEVCRAVKRLTRPPAVLVYTAFDSYAEASASYLAGADAFVHRRLDPGRLLTGIRDTRAGRRVWLPRAAAGERVAVRDVQDSLTPREREVLGLILLRYSNSEIAERLHLRLPTVKTHVRGLLRKLNVGSRRELLG